MLTYSDATGNQVNGWPKYTHTYMVQILKYNKREVEDRFVFFIGFAESRYK